MLKMDGRTPTNAVPVTNHPPRGKWNRRVDSLAQELNQTRAKIEEGSLFFIAGDLGDDVTSKVVDSSVFVVLVVCDKNRVSR